MRILVVNKFSRPVGGVEMHMDYVTRWLRDAGHTAIPFASAEDGAEVHEYSRFFPSAVEFGSSRPMEGLTALERATRSSESRRKLGELLDEQNIDAAYVLHVYHQLGTVLLNDLSRRGIPTVLSLHDYKIGCPNYRFFSERTGRTCTRCLDRPTAQYWAPVVERCWGGSRLAGAALSIEAAVTRTRRSYRRPGSVMVLNSLQEQAAVSSGVARCSIHRIAHPVELGPPRTDDGNGTMLFVGRLVPEKGVDILIEAAAKCRVPVTIAGTGRSEAALRKQAELVGAPVDFVGRVDERTVKSLMRHATALVVSSTWHEVSPLVVYEAMAADLPVIGTRVGGIVDQLADDRGLLIEPADVGALAAGMTRLAGDAAFGRALSANAREYAAEFLTKDAWSKNMVRAFQSAGANEFAA